MCIPSFLACIHLVPFVRAHTRTSLEVSLTESPCNIGQVVLHKYVCTTAQASSFTFLAHISTDFRLSL